ncbi:MAG: LamG domain-containing protein, partial [Sedimentisphaerales bacterium]
MCKKLLCLACFVLVLSAAGNAMAGLVAHYKLDETSGSIATDSSGNGFNGTITGDPVWVEGIRDGALQFDGGDVITLPASEMGLSTQAGSVAFWMKKDGPPPSNGINTIIWMGDNTTGGGFGPENETTIHLEAPDGSNWEGGEISFYNQGGAFLDSGRTFATPIVLGDNQWHHVVCTWSNADGVAKMYLEGELLIEAGNNISYDFTNIFIGTMANDTRQYTGLLDDVQFYDHALSDAEVLQAMEGSTSGASAAEPNPENGYPDAPRDVTLSWKEGPYAVTHNLFFGTDFNDVNDATIESPLGAFALEGIDVNNYDIGRLEFSTTYYWRVDEVNAPSSPGTWRGGIWSFTVEPVAYKVPSSDIAASASGSYGNYDPNDTINEAGLDASNLDLHLLDGQTWTEVPDVPEFAQGTGTNTYKYNTVVDLGDVVATSVRIKQQTNWGMTVSGLSEVRFTYIPVWAREPKPEDEAVDVPWNATLTWRAGREASQHKVYVSANEQMVIDGNAPVNTVSNNSYSPNLALGQTYYWRVDEVNNAEVPALWQGDVWSLTTEDYITVDDFEGYNDTQPYTVWDTWIDGLTDTTYGASRMGNEYEPFCDEDITYDGSEQSAPIYYNISSATKSEVFVNTANLKVGSDWTKGSPETLVLWFYGNPGNSADKLYIKLNNSQKVYYNGDQLNVTRPLWWQWNIGLSEFSVDLANVQSITIGLE